MNTDLYDDFMSEKLDTLYKEVFPALIFYASGILGEGLSFMAEDCVQEAIFRTFQNKNRIHSESGLISYLYTSVRNRCISILRKSNARAKYIHQLEMSEQDVSLKIIEAETFRQLFNALDTLPTHLRQVISMSFEDGLKNAEIASYLGVSESMIKKRKAKALELLRKSIGDEAGSDGVPELAFLSKIQK